MVKKSSLCHAMVINSPICMTFLSRRQSHISHEDKPNHSSCKLDDGFSACTILGAAGLFLQDPVQEGMVVCSARVLSNKSGQLCFRVTTRWRNKTRTRVWWWDVLVLNVYPCFSNCELNNWKQAFEKFQLIYINGRSFSILSLQKHNFLGLHLSSGPPTCNGWEKENHKFQNLSSTVWPNIKRVMQNWDDTDGVSNGELWVERNDGSVFGNGSLIFVAVAPWWSTVESH